MKNFRPFLTSYIWLLLIPVLTVGCITIKTGNKASPPPDGFVFISEDNGATWKQTVKLIRPGAVLESLANTAVTALAIDPTDLNAWYAGTADRGLVYTFSGAKDWLPTLENQGTIETVAVDPLNHCVIYAALGQAVFKSSDCNRNWQKIIVAGAPATNKLVVLLTDDKTAGRVYAGTTNGELWRSENYGNTWTMVHKFSGGLARLLMNPNDNKVIYAATNNYGLWRSADAAQTWTDVTPRGSDSRKALKGASNFHDLIIDYTVRDGLFYVSEAGLHRTDDSGITWVAVNLPVTLGRSVKLGKVAVARQNRSLIYLTVGSRLAVTTDGGAAWSWRDLPSTRPLVAMIQLPDRPILITGYGPGAKK